VGQRSLTHYKLIARTFQHVFPDTTVWVDGSLLVGSTRPLGLDAASFAERFGDPQLRDALSQAGFTDAEGLLGQYTAGADELRAFLGAGPVLTDDRPSLEYYLSLPEDTQPADLSVLGSGGGHPRR
jgi:spermidine synthase